MRMQLGKQAAREARGCAEKRGGFNWSVKNAARQDTHEERRNQTATNKHASLCAYKDLEWRREYIYQFLPSLAMPANVSVTFMVLQ